MFHLSFRQQLAAAFRWADRCGWQSGICNHFSLAVAATETEPEGILINPQGLFWSEITASSLLLMDNEGKVIEGNGEVEATAFHIHMAIHRDIPSARCILHAHPPYCTAIMCTENGRLEMCHQDSLRFFDRISYDDDFGGIANDESEGNRISDSMQGKPISFMAHHGITVTGPDIATAMDDFYYLENAARYQIIAESSQRKLKVMDENVAAELAPGFQQDIGQIKGHFVAIQRVLAMDAPDHLE